ncbi:MAG: hypothetical protein K8F60_12545 [Melioribacteraceae bacterium]|nr:hypothetical protein [Melioribacteraceae bacterium]
MNNNNKIIISLYFLLNHDKLKSHIKNLYSNDEQEILIKVAKKYRTKLFYTFLLLLATTFIITTILRFYNLITIDLLYISKNVVILFLLSLAIVKPDWKDRTWNWMEADEVTSFFEKISQVFGTILLIILSQL